MSIQQYPGGIITKNPTAPAGPFEAGAAPGIWTLDEVANFIKQGIWPTAGLSPNYIEDCFQTWLYTGNGSTQTITNGIDLSTKGGLVWIKYRDGAFGNGHFLYDTVRGAGKALQSNLTDAETAADSRFTSFNSNGFSLEVAGGSAINASTYPYVSWTFRKQPKFFDIQTLNYTSGQAVFNHNLQSVPGMVILKVSNGYSDNWHAYHTSLGNNQDISLNTNGAAFGSTPRWSATSTQFTVVTTGLFGASTIVAYFFAHNAGGFGLDGTDNVISCGSYTQGSGDTAITLGYEPQWVMIKSSDATGSSWAITDNMRAMPVSGSASRVLNANLFNSESSSIYGVHATSTGFISNGFTSGEFIYIAIRRGPMKVPTTGTSVFGLSARSGTGANATVTGGQTDDAVLVKNRGSAVASLFSSRLTGTGYLVTSTDAAEVAAGTTILQANPWDVMDGVKVGTTSTITNASANTFINYLFKRAPSVFDVVCYTGTGTAKTINHNLGVVPELIIVKARSTAGGDWSVYSKSLTVNQYIVLSSSLGFGTFNLWNATAPTSSVFSVSTYFWVNEPAYTYVAYLFATCAGVSKVGSYTGNGTTQTIDCGFDAGGARFVLIKRTDSTGDWYTYDTARGMTSGTDPYLSLNSTAAEVATAGSVTTVSTGFALNSAELAAINVSGGTYIFLAIA